MNFVFNYQITEFIVRRIQPSGARTLNQTFANQFSLYAKLVFPARRKRRDGKISSRFDEISISPSHLGFSFSKVWSCLNFKVKRLLFIGVSKPIVSLGYAWSPASCVNLSGMGLITHQNPRMSLDENLIWSSRFFQNPFTSRISRMQTQLQNKHFLMISKKNPTGV